jgi:uncharacterized protein YdeI (YjbR/CyaY-like superfamily)
VRPTYFDSAAAFRHWLEEHHSDRDELWVGFWKKATGRDGVTYSEAVDEAICFGWIDGLKKRVDDLSYTHRFTPRRPKSRWSAVNVRRATELIAAGRMADPGLTAFRARNPEEPAGYSYESRPAELEPGLDRRFRERPEAWAFFTAQAPGYRRTSLHWVASAKREQTRRRRLEKLITASAAGERLL